MDHNTRHILAAMGLLVLGYPHPEARLVHINHARGLKAADLTPRQFRVLEALLRSSVGISREAIDHIAGASNGPDVISQIRKRFALCKYKHLICDRVQVIDRDGLPSNPGRYRLTPEGRAKLAEMVRIVENTHV